MEVRFNIDKKNVAVIVIVAIIAIVAIAYIGGYIWKPIAYSSGREASEAIINVSSAVDQIRSIIEDIDRRLGR